MICSEYSTRTGGFFFNITFTAHDRVRLARGFHRGSAHMYKHTHAGVCAGFSAAVDTGERRGSARGREKG